MKPSHACPINVDEAQEVSVDKGLLREEVAAAPAVKSKEVLAYFRNVVRKQLALMKQ